MLDIPHKDYDLVLLDLCLNRNHWDEDAQLLFKRVCDYYARTAPGRIRRHSEQSSVRDSVLPVIAMTGRMLEGHQKTTITESGLGTSSGAVYVAGLL